jgi:hypothetical protein
VGVWKPPNSARKFIESAFDQDRIEGVQNPFVAARTPVTRRPPHRSVRQDCYIRLLPQMAGVKAQVRMRVHLRTWNAAIDQLAEPFRGHRGSLAPSPEGTVPAPDHLSPKAVQTIHVAGYCMIVEVALYDRLQPLPENPP